MINKIIALAAASLSALALYSTAASAQATQFYRSPAEVGTRAAAPYARPAPRPYRIDRRTGAFYAFAGAPRPFGFARRHPWNKHTNNIRNY